MAGPHPPPSTIARRRFLAGTAGAAGLLVAAVPGAWAAPSHRIDDPFTLGVASGDPTPTGVVLWTRLAPRPLDPDGGMPARAVPVQWDVATGPRIRNVIRRGVRWPIPALRTACMSRLMGWIRAGPTGIGSGPRAT